MATLEDFAGYTPTWCAGCGNWGIGRAIQTSLSQQALDPSSTFMVFDIGCSGNMNDFVNAYAMHSLHGRSLANAVGMKLGNHDMPLLVVGGDGALLGEGGNHLLHACRGNHDITVVIHDNRVYGLTRGQVAPTATKGYKSKTTPSGIVETSVNALLLAVTQGATFVAQSFAGNMPHVAQMITAGMKHKGFSVVNVLQPCVTFNKVNTYGYYFKNTYALKDHDPRNWNQALEKAAEPLQEKFPLGVIYESDVPAYHEQLPQLSETALVRRESASHADELIKYFA